MALLNEVQSQSAGPYFFERPPLKLARINCGTAVTKQDFEPLLNLPIVSTLRSSKLHGDGLVKAIAVRMADDVSQSFIDGASDRRALLHRESKNFGQTFNRCPRHR
jgi:hypothetical protein